MKKKKRKYADSVRITAENERIHVVIDPDDGEIADVVVCRTLTKPLIIADNLTGVCSKCGAAIQFRPHSPKRPPKICDTCAFPAMQEKMVSGELVTMITPKTLDEVIKYMVKKWSN